MSVRSDEDAKKLEPLSHIQELQTQVEEIPALQKQINDLKGQIGQDSQGMSQKQDTITQLASTVLSQQQTIAVDARKNLESTAAAINQNIERNGISVSSNLDLLRADTESAIVAGTAPDRRLSPSQINAVTEALANTSCTVPVGPDSTEIKLAKSIDYHVNLMWTIGEESAGYASDFVSALNAGKGGSCGIFAFRASFDPNGRVKGAFLFSPDWSKPTKIAILLRDAFNQSHIPYSLGSGPIGSYQKYGAFIVIGAK